MPRLKISLYIFITALLLNYPWEIFHSALYLPSPAIKAILPLYLIRAAAIDALIINGIYWLIALINRNSRWIENIKPKDYFLSALFGLLISIFIEIRAVYFLGKWQYSASMPIIPFIPVGLTPILQMLVLPILTFMIIKKIAKNN